MTVLPVWDLACFSYLAHAQILHVPRYPAADHGATVDRSRTCLAADGPITATAATTLDLHTVLVANPVAEDLPGRLVLGQLHQAGVHYAPGWRRPAATAQLTVITDSLGTRTWFADLAHVHQGLAGADLAPLAEARLAYIDCYEVLTPLAAHAIDAATSTGVPVLLNLGNDPIHPDIADAARRAAVYAVQTGLPEPHADHAAALARDILERLRPHVAVVTLGALGAVAVTDERLYRITARPVRVSDTHGAGAAFSAALAAAHLEGADVPAVLEQACAAGTAHCTAPPDKPAAKTGFTPSHRTERTTAPC